MIRVEGKDKEGRYCILETNDKAIAKGFIDTMDTYWYSIPKDASYKEAAERTRQRASEAREEKEWENTGFVVASVPRKTKS